MDHEAMTADIRLLPDNVIYKAHFPEKPITPGVCIVQMAVELFARCVAKNTPSARL